MTPHGVHVARFVELDAPTVYQTLRLRSQVFVVEQECAYLDVDGRDTEPRTLHLWIVDDGTGAIASYLRVLAGPPAKIGRVCTAAPARGQGHAARLLDHALFLAGRPVLLDAQSYLCDWYRRFGFEISGDEFVEDGIPHRPMTLRR